MCSVLAGHSITASFFFSVGPDNMGRHLWRLLRPAFLAKMLRSRASKLYGWDILFKGTFWPGPVIGDKCAGVIRAAAEAGHEIGFHAWDHHEWQSRLERMSPDDIRQRIRQGCEKIAAITGTAPSCSAAPAWQCTDAALLVKDGFPFNYNSDCRGDSMFRPVVGGNILQQPQVPVTLPTYDEVIGRNGVTDANYNEHMRSLLRPDALNVLAIHAEVEGIACIDMFRAFVKDALAQGDEFVPLGWLAMQNPVTHKAPLVRKDAAGREGWLSWQGETG